MPKLNSNANKLLTIHNLCKYMCTNEITKKITRKLPIALSNSIIVSHRNDKNIAILPNHRLGNNQFLHKSSLGQFFLDLKNIKN